MEKYGYLPPSRVKQTTSLGEAPTQTTQYKLAYVCGSKGGTFRLQLGADHVFPSSQPLSESLNPY